MSEETISELATTTLFIDQRWETATQAQQKAFAYILAARIDRLRRDINELYDRLNAAPDAAQAQGALEIFHRAVQATAHNSDLDLLSVTGEHHANAHDERRQALFARSPSTKPETLN